MWSFRRKVRAAPVEENMGRENVEENTLLSALLFGDAIGEEQAMQVPAFAACVNRISDTVSMIPIRLYKRNTEKKEVEAIENDVRVKLLNSETGDTLSAVEMKRAFVRDFLLQKGGFIYINKFGNKTQSLHYVDAREVSFFYNEDPIFKDYDILIRGKRYYPHQFLKILRNTKDGRDGISVVEENSTLLSVAFNSLNYEETLVKTGGNKKGFIKSPKKLAKQAIDALKEAWRRLYQNNTENVVVLNEGLEFQEASNTSVEMQLNENKKTNANEICKIFGIPPAVLDGNASDEDKANYIQYCIQPILKEFECTLNQNLLLEREKKNFFFEADTSELTKGDIEKRYRAYETASKNGFMQIDEIRYKENLPPLGLDFVRLGLQDVLFDPNTKQFYIPNMNASGGLGQEGENAKTTN